MEIHRNARVEATDGEVGRLRHAIIDPDTGAITHIVVRDAGYEWLVDAADVVTAEHGRIRLRGRRDGYYTTPFDREAFRRASGLPAASEPTEPLHRPDRGALEAARQPASGRVLIERRSLEQPDTGNEPLQEKWITIAEGAVQTPARQEREVLAYGPPASPAYVPEGPAPAEPGFFARPERSAAHAGR